MTRLGQGLSLGGALLGAAGLIGWLTGVQTLITVLPGQPPMMPNTAVALLLLGIVGALRSSTSRALAAWSLFVPVVIFVLAIGVLTTAEYTFDLPFSIDQLLIRSDAGPYPGRPSLPAALALALLSAALLVWDWRPKKRFVPAEWLILSSGVIAFAVLLGQAFGAGELYELTDKPITGVAIHAALSLLMISAGFLLQRPDASIIRVTTSSGPGGLLLRRLEPIAVLIPVLFGATAAWLLSVPGVKDISLLFAGLTVVSTLVSLLILATTAERLNRTHEALEQSRARILRSESEQRLLAEVGSVLSGTLELEDTLSNIAQLIVANLADLCVISFIDDDGVARRVRVFCRDPSKAWICDALMRAPPGREQVHIAQSVLETRRPAFIAEVTPDLVRSWAANDEQLAALEGIDPKSVMMAPLLVRERLLGALSLISADAARPYGPDDLRITDAIAGRSAVFLENARLYRESKRATEARDDVLGVVAHDLRNPLSAIASVAAILRRRGAEHELAEDITECVRRMNRLIEDLLDVTRIEAGHLSLKQSRLPVAKVVSDALAGQKPLASSASIELRLDAAPGLPDIWADRDRLLQVFENLFGNAIKFTKPGGRITLSAAARTDEILFSVSDTGCGIANSHLPHVFDRFWQAPGAMRRGMGFGLAIVKGIIETHGGRVWAESVPGRGTTFLFTIPLAKSQAAPRSHKTALRVVS
jgi:signal transduction histidine kinase